MIPKATENTVSALLSEELKKREVRAQPFSSVETPKGRREVDVWCANGGTYLVEAKFSRREIVDALSKVSDDYLKHRKLLGIQGCFTLLYPEELTRPMDPELVKRLAHELEFEAIAIFPPEDARKNFTTCRGRLSEIADFLAKNILAPPERIEPDINYIIKVLRESAQYIMTGLKDLSSNELEDLFGGEDVFRNILQFEKGKYPVEDLRLAAGYMLINQLLFYHILSRRKPSDFPEIDVDKIEQPADLNEYFAKVLGVNYRSVLSYDVVSRIPEKYIDAVRGIIGAINCLSPEKVGGDLLGTIFHNLVPFETRKNVAAFYTNVLAAELLAHLAIDRHDARVADLAIGSGGLLVAAYRRKKNLLVNQKGSFTQEDHRRFVENDLFGVDVMPFAANVAACHLALQSPEFLTDKVQIAVWDSTDLSPAARIPSLADLGMVLRGQLTVDMFAKAGPPVKGVVGLKKRWGEEIMARSYDVVIMNPPFTRQERLPNNYKKLLFDRFKRHREYLHGQLGYYGYFVLLADRFVHSGGRMALVLPATVLRVKSCEGIRRLWAENYHVEHIITTWHRSAFSESTRFREILLVAKKGKPDPKAKTVVTVVKTLPTTLEEAREMAESIQNSKSDWEDWRLAVKVYDYSELKEDTDNWFKYIAVRDLGLLDKLEMLLDSDKLVQFSKVAEAQRIDLEHLKFKDFHGFVLYDESRAEKRIDAWILDRVEKNELIARHADLGLEIKVPLASLGRGLRRLSHIKTIDVTNTSDYLILSWFDEIKEMAETFLIGRDLKTLDSRIIDQWGEKFDKRKANLLIARRFDLSASGTSLLAFYSDEPIIGVDMWCIKELPSEYAKILALWFNSTLGLLQTFVTRTETRGAWMKIHDYTFDEFMVPALEKIGAKEREFLLSQFEKCKKIEFPDILHQLKTKYPARMEIDKAFLKVIGYKGDADSLLVRLYELLAHEIETLKNMMKEATD
jgi:hypothetical protein